MNENKFVKICGSLINLRNVSEIRYNEGVIYFNCCGQYADVLRLQPFLPEMRDPLRS